MVKHNVTIVKILMDDIPIFSDTIEYVSAIDSPLSPQVKR